MRYFLIFGLCFLVSIHCALSTTEACNQLDECLKTAEEKYEECEDILEEKKAGNGKKKNQCKQEQKELIEGRKAARKQKTKDYSDCISRRLEHAIELTKKQAKKCEKVLSKTKDRSKRQADKEKRKKQREERRKQREEKKRRRAERKQIMQRFRKCMREHKTLKKTCKPFIKCCSESAICHAEYELSEIHDGIKQFNLDILHKKRECQAQKRRRTKPKDEEEEDEEEKIQDSDIVSDDQIINDDS